ncbi:MAG: hypothetical protein CMJ64_20430 [Planctomycetaceae bacterium]|nr:hypothetical protein [Planctomycetaceae bacterium]
MFHEALSSAGNDLSATLAAEDAHYAVNRMEDQSLRMEADIERLLLLSEALWNILKEQHGYKDDELVRRVLEVDSRDGRIDGRVAHRPPEDCPHCDRPVPNGRRYCLYCGQPVPVNLFAR